MASPTITTAPFADYANAGYLADILPVIPPGAKLSAGSKLPETHLGKVPGERTASGEWHGMPNWAKRPAATAADVAKWSKWDGAGLCIRTGNLIAFDLDVLSEDLADALEALIMQEAGKPVPVRFGNAPKRLLAYRVAEPLKKTRIAFIMPGSGEQAVEFLGDGQQFIAEGIHPKTGKPYHWRGGLSLGQFPIHMLPVLTVAQVETIREGVETLIDMYGGELVNGSATAAASGGARQPIGSPALMAQDQGMVARALDAIPNDLDREGWIGMTAAFKAATGGSEDGYEAYEAWSMQYPDNSQDDCRAAWDSIDAAEIGADYVYSRARQHGFVEVEEFGHVELTTPAQVAPPEQAEKPKRMAPRLQQIPEGFDPRNLPVREYLLGKRFMRKAITAGFGAPGVSKSTFSLLTAVAIASGRELTGERVREPGNVCIYNAEDDTNEILRRVSGICKKHKIDFAEIRARFFFMSGTETPLFVAVKDKDAVRATQAAGEVVADLLANNIVYLALDPLASLHNGASENDNSDMNSVLGILKQIASKGNCAIDLVHHTVKNRTGNSEAGAGDMNMGRGAGAIGGAIRFAYTLSAMSEETANDFGINPDEAMRYVCLMDAKSNYGLKRGTKIWFRLDSVYLDNQKTDDLEDEGDSVGVHELRDLSHLRREAEEAQEARDADKRQALAELIAGAMPEDECGIKDVLPAVMKAGSVKESEARDRINAAIPEGGAVFVRISGVAYSVTRRRKGDYANAPMLLIRERDVNDAE